MPKGQINVKVIKPLSPAIAFAIALIIFAMYLPTPAHAAANITLNPVSGTVGTTIQVSGNSFTGRLATIHWDDKAIASEIPITETGELHYDFTIPKSYKGAHTIRIADDSNWSESIASAQFTVSPHITVFPDAANQTAELTIKGYGFSSSEKEIMVTWDDKVMPGNINSADTLGTWSTIIPIPKTTRGEHYIGAFSSTTDASEIGKTKFIVTPYVKVTPLSGIVGTQLFIYGWGFRANEDGLSITWDGELVKYNIRAEPDGSMIVDGSKVPHFSSTYTGDTRETFFIPPTTQGEHILGIYGSSFTPKGVFNDTTIEVVPDIKLRIEPHIEGAKVTIDGAGFASNETVTVNIDQINKSTTVNSDSTGSFSTVLVVPPSNVKEYAITTSGAKGNSARAILSNIDINIIPPETKIKLLSPAEGTRLTTFNSVGDVMLGTIKYLFGVVDYLRGSLNKNIHSPTITFVWTTSSDLTGISYALQVAQNRNFTSLVMDKRIPSHSKYTLPENEYLASGYYYWRVKFIDPTGQESQWSEPSEFEIVSMSTKVAILSSVILALIIAAIVFGILTAIANFRRY